MASKYLNMEKLKVGFIDFWPEIDQENIFLPILKKYYDVEVTKNNPDVIFHSIYAGFKETHTFNCKKILFLGENYRAANYGSDFSISFDPHTDKNYHLPLWQFYLILRPDFRDILFGPRIHYDEFDRFASFTVSNGGNFFRNGAYRSLKEYKKVYSYGRYLTNDFELQQMSAGVHWREPKFRLFNKYHHKFTIAFENNSYPGYTTEKLMDAFLAGSLPIYWGDPTVTKNWNKDAFINAMTDGDFINTVKRLDVNDEEFQKIYTAPIFTEEQRQRHQANIDGFEEWLIKAIKA